MDSQRWEDRAVIALSFSDEHLDHVSDVCSAKEMRNQFLKVFERHILLKNSLLNGCFKCLRWLTEKSLYHI